MSDPESAPAEPSAYQVPALDRALTIFELLAGHPEGLRMREIAERLELPANSVFRITGALEARGYLLRDDKDMRYRLSRKLLSLGYAAIGEDKLIEHSLDLMQQLRDTTGETVLIGVRTDTEGVVLEQVASSQPVKFLVDPGTHFPLHTSAPGKVLVAFMRPDERTALLKRMKFTRFTDRTLDSRAKFEAEIENVLANGYRHRLRRGNRRPALCRRSHFQPSRAARRGAVGHGSQLPLPRVRAARHRAAGRACRRPDLTAFRLSASLKIHEYPSTTPRTRSPSSPAGRKATASASPANSNRPARRSSSPAATGGARCRCGRHRNHRHPGGRDVHRGLGSGDRNRSPRAPAASTSSSTTPAEAGKSPPPTSRAMKASPTASRSISPVPSTAAVVPPR